ncbi:hypothetical protein Fot_41597 [Forsythia ovata]|uniref:Uncharacterized protein n=1 Tax=Forsythia ovata TaxID=205694 RepID=A0ABD1RIR8_9LAMI
MKNQEKSMGSQPRSRNSNIPRSKKQGKQSRRSSVIITDMLETDMNRESILETVIEPESQTLQGDEPQVKIPTQDDRFYVSKKGSHQWDNVEWTEELRQQGEVEGDRQSYVGEDARPDEDDILVESDYEMDERSGPQFEPTNHNNVNINIGFSDFFEGSGRNCKSDY